MEAEDSAEAQLPVPPGEPHPLTSRRWIALIALAALLLFAAVAGALAWRQYGDAKRVALNESRTRAVLAATVFDVYFDGRIGTLSSIAKAPAVVRADEEGILAYLKSVQPPAGKLFPGGLAWINRRGIVRVSSTRARPQRIADVSDRSYFASAIRTGRPFVSEGLTARVSGQQVVVMAVPTRNGSGQITGVLTGSLLVKPPNPSQASFDLGYKGLAIIDRRDQSILAGFVHPDKLGDPARFARSPSGVLSDTRGLEGESGHVVAYARARVPEWTILLDRPRSAVFAAARRSLVLELALLAGVALLDLALLAWVFARARSAAQIERRRALQRRLRYEQEHQVATTLQRSLLAEVPTIDAIDSAARYQAGSTGLEVGGDWFDVVRRPDGIVQVTVGDVAGRGVAAAALMGQLRNAFRAYAYDHTSPAEIMRRLHRHMAEDEMATAVCISIDPYAREIAYSSAGHPPPLLRDDDSAAVALLDLAQAPPLGASSAATVREARLALPRRATLLAYTDGVIERRDRAIDEGIARLRSALGAADPVATAAALADTIIHDVAEVTAADDDVALLVMRFAEVPATLDMRLPANSAALPELLRRAELWGAARGLDGDGSRLSLVAIDRAFSDAIRDSNGTARDAVHIHAHHDGRELLVKADVRRGALA